ncbi:MAG: RluA family pseudouridine synthase [Planctomycetota bacterium]|nr:RluA family pseudouridine synthase [Planctomycetota bacterium]MDA1113846.1 RluA family pseudouridine synthase [Planctomycetota bacterium]
MSNRIVVEQAGELFSLLVEQLNDWSRNKVRQRLQNGCVLVNGRAIAQARHNLKVDDVVEILARGHGVSRTTAHLEPLFQDHSLIAIYKPAGLLSVASAKEPKRHALGLLREQLTRSQGGAELYPVHRIDRETSGVLLFATSREVKDQVTAAWSGAEKTYLAVVEGRLEPANGTIDQALRMDAKGFRAHVSARPEAKRAVTHFQTEKCVKGRSLLHVQIETGRQHQIRAHFSWAGHPVVGDTRYGQPDRRLGLHAWKLSLDHPLSGERLEIEAPAPEDLFALLS